MNDTLARWSGVTRRYGDVLALDDVSLDVPAGQLMGLLGPNGAGKSTLINLLLGLRRPDTGSVELFGGDPRVPANRALLGCTPQETALPPTLTVREVVDFVAGHHPDPVPTAVLLDELGLTGQAARQTGGLSGGQRRRLSVALALVGRPRLLVLDEPTTGLDIDARHLLWGKVRDFHQEGGTVVVTSHYLEEIEALAERVVVVADGRVLVDDTLDAVRSRVQQRRVSLRAGALPALHHVVRAQEERGHWSLYTEDSDALVRELVRADVEFQDLEVSSASLEEAFLALTADDRATTTAKDPA
ncbi:MULTISPECIES: ABC transporter ATP-binding protein [unclassified Serinicoccus]|uniref:ABC transporter ATP-binding protein n=1 Tax=unclassified Serinicoccus TaxID=2643101 RepID=UPI0038549CD3